MRSRDMGPVIQYSNCIVSVFLDVGDSYRRVGWGGINSFVLKKALKFLHMVALSSIRRQHRSL